VIAEAKVGGGDGGNTLFDLSEQRNGFSRQFGWISKDSGEEKKDSEGYVEQITVLAGDRGSPLTSILAQIIPNSRGFGKFPVTYERCRVYTGQNSFPML
jgi:hypothetical protein